MATITLTAEEITYLQSLILGNGEGLEMVINDNDPWYGIYDINTGKNICWAYNPMAPGGKGWPLDFVGIGVQEKFEWDLCLTKEGQKQLFGLEEDEATTYTKVVDFEVIKDALISLLANYVK